MTGYFVPARHALLPALLALAVAGCGGASTEPDADAVGEAVASPAEESSPGPQAGAPAVAVEAEAEVGADGEDSQTDPVEPQDEGDAQAGFDIASLPLSTAALGEFPYFSLPEGYRESGGRQTARLDFGQVALWVGDRFQPVEGEVYATGIRVVRDSGKQYSALEVARNLEHVVASAGGVEVFAGQVPREAQRDRDIEALMRAYPNEARCRGSSPVQVFALRRDDGNVWVRTCTAQHFAGLIVVREEAFVPTSSLLPATEMKRQLDADGRVALQVNFATDSADILPDSQPQLEQVLQLLRDDPALRLSIDGHTDATGDAGHNQRLSEARAQAVVAVLTAQGIDASRLEAKGHGQSQPVADNDTDEGRAQNRRVELVRI